MYIDYQEVDYTGDIFLLVLRLQAWILDLSYEILSAA